MAGHCQNPAHLRLLVVPPAALLLALTFPPNKQGAVRAQLLHAGAIGQSWSGG